MVGRRLGFRGSGNHRHRPAHHADRAFSVGRSLGFCAVIATIEAAHPAPSALWTFGARLAGTGRRRTLGQSLGDQRHEQRRRSIMVAGFAERGGYRPGRHLPVGRSLSADPPLSLDIVTS